MLTQEASLRIRNAFPTVLWQDVDVALLSVEAKYEDLTTTVSPDSIGPILLSGEELFIPYRVYLLEPELDRLLTFTHRQKLVLSAVLSRNDNGYIREKHLKELLQSSESWIPPFVLQLLGEYVLPIIRVVEDHDAVLKRSEYCRFVNENPAFLRLLKQRIISYWNCYYRGMFPRVEDYPAFQMAETFKHLSIAAAEPALGADSP